MARRKPRTLGSCPPVAELDEAIHEADAPGVPKITAGRRTPHSSTIPGSVRRKKLSPDKFVGKTARNKGTNAQETGNVFIAWLRRNLWLCRASKTGTATNFPGKLTPAPHSWCLPTCRGSTPQREQSNHCLITSQELALLVAKVIAILAQLRYRYIPANNLLNDLSCATQPSTSCLEPQYVFTSQPHHPTIHTRPDLVCRFQRSAATGC